jgi:hypothetical protein
LALAALAELLNRSVRTARDLERRLDIRPIAVIPYIATPREALLRRSALRLGLILALAGVAAGLLLLDQFVTPLSALFEQLGQTLGLDRLES